MRTTIAKKKPKSSKGKPKGRNLTLPEMAEGIGVSVVTIHKYLKRGCPRTSIAAIQKWRSENIKAVAENLEVSEIGIECKKAEIAERWENARARQIKNDAAEGKLIRVAEQQFVASLQTSKIRNRLQSVPMRVANVCPSEIKAVVKELVEDVIGIIFKEMESDLLDIPE